jgi:hypothetical protein
VRGFPSTPSAIFSPIRLSWKGWCPRTSKILALAIRRPAMMLSNVDLPQGLGTDTVGIKVCGIRSCLNIFTARWLCVRNYKQTGSWKVQNSRQVFSSDCFLSVQYEEASVNWSRVWIDLTILPWVLRGSWLAPECLCQQDLKSAARVCYGAPPRCP